MQSLTTIYLVRHAQSQLNKAYENKEQYKEHGELGSDLSSEGVKQAHQIANHLHSIHFDAIFSSDLLRATHTAKAIAYHRSVPVITNMMLREKSWGAWKSFEEGEKIKAEIKRLQSGLSDKEKMNVKIADIESEADAATRLVTFLHEIIQAYKGKTLCVVAHGNIMRSFLVCLGFAKYDELSTGSIKNTGYIKFTSDGVNFWIQQTLGVIKKVS